MRDICTIARHERLAHPADGPDEISIAVNWAATEGWNPGLATTPASPRPIRKASSSASSTAHLHAQPCPRYCCDGPVCCPDHRLRPALCPHHRAARSRGLVWINVTTNPTAEWIARQLPEAFPWDEAPHHLIRDRDQIYGAIVTRRLHGFAERLIGSIRRECVDHFIVLGEAHLRRILRSYARYYNDIRTHRSLDKDAPVSRPVQRTRGPAAPRIFTCLLGLHPGTPPPARALCRRAL
jgi:hypothetical protein